MVYGKRIENGETLRFEKVSDEEVIKIVRKAVELGVNLLIVRIFKVGDILKNYWLRQ